MFQFEAKKFGQAPCKSSMHLLAAFLKKDDYTTTRNPDYRGLERMLTSGLPNAMIQLVAPHMEWKETPVQRPQA